MYPKQTDFKSLNRPQSLRIKIVKLTKSTVAKATLVGGMMLSLGTIHKRRRQFFRTFDTPLRHVGSFLKLSVGIFDQCLTPPNCRRHLLTAPCISRKSLGKEFVVITLIWGYKSHGPTWYLQPHYGNGVLGNVYLSAGQH